LGWRWRQGIWRVPREFAEAFRLKPDGACNNLGLTLKEQGKFKRLKNFRRALLINPGYGILDRIWKTTAMLRKLMQLLTWKDDH
jgi:hypothetical protein